MGDKQESLQNIRHSLAHLLAAAVLELWPQTKHAIGPVIENGFYFDFELPRPISQKDLSKIEKKMRQILLTWDKFECVEISDKEAKKFYHDNPYKLELIEELVKKNKTITFYKSGNYIDLCKGGHVKDTKEINPDGFRLTHLAGAYWRGSEKNPMLTRIYGIAFNTKKELEDYVALQEKIEKRDHRILAESLDLFSQQPIAPGAIFWHPKGMTLWRLLEEFMRKKLDASGYGEVSTPIMVKKEVFERSGHWDYYREHMFTLEVEKEEYVLKPMNCPESTFIYASRIRSYRDLPLRFSEITDKLYRNELSGTLGGLFRVRQLSQDDAHIYCRQDQVEKEVKELLKLAQEIYKTFSLQTSYKLATKPDDAMGDAKLWAKAERSLEKVLKESKKKFEIKVKDGAFYGPKIDIHVKDSLGRDWQVSTIQLDFHMPMRFNLSYINEKGQKETPVMIHRAIFGTFERFIGILIEHYGGAFPFWLTPIQIALLNVTGEVKTYSNEIAKKLRERGYRIYVDDRNETIGKKIREAELQKIPYLFIVGKKEQGSDTIAIRRQGQGDLGRMTIDKFFAMIAKEDSH